MMFTTVQDDVCMIMKFLSNSPVTHVAANTHPAVPVPAVITITCNYNFAVNKWNQLTCMSLSLSHIYSLISLFSCLTLSVSVFLSLCQSQGETPDLGEP